MISGALLSFGINLRLTFTVNFVLGLTLHFCFSGKNIDLKNGDGDDDFIFMDDDEREYRVPLNDILARDLDFLSAYVVYRPLN